MRKAAQAKFQQPKRLARLKLLRETLEPEEETMFQQPKRLARLKQRAKWHQKSQGLARGIGGIAEKIFEKTAKTRKTPANHLLTP